MTEAERRLWRALRELKTPNRFRRQHPIGQYVVDFACPAARLAIEVDGGNTHRGVSEMMLEAWRLLITCIG
jgi:very-short-patch-repair endonuclease